MNLNIDNFGGKGVVPVYCGSYICGTAFFVSGTNLLTAGHVLAEYYLDQEVLVAVIVEGEMKKCQVVFHQDVPDIAVLRCVDYVCPNEYVLPLLSCKFKKGTDLLVVGYPRELGNGVDYFGVTVKNSREKADMKGGFDRMVVRTDSFGFNSYEGFSGAPVINDFGRAVGIETDQLYYSLGYVSIYAIKHLVDAHTGIHIEENDELYDNTPFGLWTSRNHILCHTGDKLKTRYNDRLHVENADVERLLKSFCGFGFEEECNRIHNLYKEWYNKLLGRRKKTVDDNHVLAQYLQDGVITRDVSGAISDLFYLNGSQEDLPSDYKKELREIRRSINVWLRNKGVYEDYQFMHVSGRAGCGKSHLLYQVAKEITNKQRVYMFVGSEFSPLEDPVMTISRVLGWKYVDPLITLDKELDREYGKTATIVIDALNEGAGTHFWTEQVPVLKSKIERCKHLKLIVSLRTLSEEDKLNDVLRAGWLKQELDGFADREKAIRDYFAEYDISADPTPYTKIEEFSNPLFLRMFSETYYSLSDEVRQKVLRLPIYGHYIQKRNYEVSDGVDEDPKQNVTTKFILWVAQRSLEQFKCDDLPRQLAYRRSRKICPYRTWQKNLLRNCLEANLLREYSTNTGDFVDFEFDSMGDYLKAERLLSRKCDDKDRFRTLLILFDKFESTRKARGNWQKQYNFIRAFLSLWNPPASIWGDRVFVKGKLTSLLLSCSSQRNLRDDKNTLTPDLIGEILKQNPDFIEPELILQNIELYSQGLIDHVHTLLKTMSMADRDLAWSSKVNGLYDGAYYDDLIGNLHLGLQHEIETLLIVEIWMLAASYPYLRAYVIRKVKGLLCDNPEMAVKMIDIFHDVDDPYILEGLYAAIYGAVVFVDRVDYSRSICEKLYAYHYEENRAPQDLMVRHWTLKVFELAAHQDPASVFWEKAQPPYTPSEDIFEIMPAEDYEKDGYFGSSYGSNRITHSLFHWDFSRYIIGTNSNNVSSVFFKNGQAVPLERIEKAVAFLIKHRFGWNDELGKYDADVPYQTSSENTVERIGKKYQWIGLYRVYAYLCDTCQMKINIWSANEKYAEKNYPWYAPERSYFDPTLAEQDYALRSSLDLFDLIRPVSTMDTKAQEWLIDERLMPPLYFVVKDKDGIDWVLLQAYSTIKEIDNGEEREQFVFYNGSFAKKSGYDKLRKWAEDANFYGRWMPEHGGSIDYRWNEYPWADSYRSQFIEEDLTYNEGGGEMMLAYEAQLQEYFTGMKDEHHFLTTAYMPCREIMEMFNWHTAERGIIRDAEGGIVAINREIPDEPLHALLVRRDKLDAYLQARDFVLFWSLVGEKQFGGHPNALIERLTGAAAYLAGQGVDIMQPLRKEPPAPIRERVRSRGSNPYVMPDYLLKKREEDEQAEEGDAGE